MRSGLAVTANAIHSLTVPLNGRLTRTNKDWLRRHATLSCFAAGLLSIAELPESSVRFIKAYFRQVFSLSLLNISL